MVTGQRFSEKNNFLGTFYSPAPIGAPQVVMGTLNFLQFLRNQSILARNYKFSLFSDPERGPTPSILRQIEELNNLLGNGPNRERSPAEWGEFPFVHLSVRTTPPLGHPAIGGLLVFGQQPR